MSYMYEEKNGNKYTKEELIFTAFSKLLVFFWRKFSLFILFLQTTEPPKSCEVLWNQSSKNSQWDQSGVGLGALQTFT